MKTRIYQSLVSFTRNSGVNCSRGQDISLKSAISISGAFSLTDSGMESLSGKQLRGMVSGLLLKVGLFLLFSFSVFMAHASLTVTAVSVSGSQTGNLIYGTGANVTYTITLSQTGGGSGSTSFTLNWEGATPSGVTFSPAATISLTGDGQIVSLTLTSSSTTVAGNYNFTVTAGGKTSNAATFAVSGKSLTITATGPSKPYGTALTVGTSSTNFTASGAIAGEAVTSVILSPNAAGLSPLSSAGNTYVVTPSSPSGTGGFSAGNYVITYTSYTGTVAAKPLTITATGPSKIYGAGLTTGTSSANFTAGATGVGGEAVTGVTLTPDVAGMSSIAAAGTPYSVTPSLATGIGGFLTSNYAITYTPGNFTVAAAPLAIAANNQSKTYGNVLTLGTSSFTQSGLKNGEVIGSVTLSSSGSSATANTGSYNITPSAATGGTFSGGNYSITYGNGMVTVNPAPLVITAIDRSKQYGSPLILGGASFTASGLKNGETTGSVTLNSTGAVSTAAPGIYAITPSAATGGTFWAANYSSTYVNGTLTVDQANTTTTISSDNTTACSGANVTFTANIAANPAGVSGIVEFFDGAISLGTSSITNDAASITFSGLGVGSHSITASYSGDANYMASTSGVLTQNINQSPTIANAGPDQTGMATCGLTLVTLAGNTPVIGTGTWSTISGGGGLVADPSNPASDFSGTAGTAYVLRWTIVNGSCISTDDVMITFNAAPTVSNAGPDQSGTSTCGLTTVTLAANAPAVGTGSWTIVTGSGGTISAPSDPNSTFTGSPGSSYTLRWTVSNPCGSSSDDVDIVFIQAGTAANAGADQTGSATCGLSNITLSGNAPTIGTGNWSIVSGSGGTITTPGNPASTFTGTAGTTYILRWTISNSPCTSSSDDVTITFSGSPTPASAGPDQTGVATCGITTVTLSGNTPTVGTGSWTIVSGSVGTITAPSNPASTFTGTAGTTYTLRWTISNSPCTSSADDVIITFNKNAATANAGPDQTGLATCGLTTVALAGNTPAIGTGAWSIVSGSGGTIATPTSATSAFTGTAGATYTLRWTIANSPCTSSSDDVIITFNQTPTTANAGPDQSAMTTCGLTTVTLAGNTPAAGTGSWSIVSGSGGTIATPTNATSAFTGTAGSTYTLRWTIANSPCTASSDDVIITFNQNPTTANAGPDQTGMATCGLTTITLVGNTPAAGTGNWSIISGSGGSVATPGSATSAFTGTAGSTYTLRWTISGSPCTASSDDVIISFNKNPSTANAGPDQTSSATCGITAVTLAGNTPSVGTGNWTVISGSGGNMTAPTSASSSFSGAAGSTYTLRWTISSNPCTTSYDDVIITFNQYPAAATIAYAGSPFCTSLSTAQNVTRTGTSGGTYSSSPGLNINASTGAITPSSSTAGIYTITYTLINGLCSKTYTTSVTITALPTASISYPPASYCKPTYGGGTINAGITGTGAYTGGTFSAAPSGLSIVGSGANAGRINPSLSTAGLYTITYTTPSSGGCGAVAATTTVSIGDAIVNNNPILKLACNTSASTADVYIDQDASALGGGNGIYTYVWEFSNNGVSGPWNVVGGNTSSLNISQIAPANKNGFYRRTVISGGCSNVSSSVHVNVANSLLAASYSITGSNYCITANAGAPVGLTGSAAPANGIFVAYDLYKNGSYTGQEVIGDGTPISFGNQFAGTYKVKAIVSVTGGSSCPALDLPDSLIVAIDAAVPTANAGANQSLCSSSSTTLTGSSAGPYAGAWTLVSGSGAVTAPGNYNTGITGLAPGNNIFKWKIVNGTCADSSNVTVFMSQATTVPTSLGTTSGSICKGSSTTVTQNGGSLGTAAYWQWYTDASYTTPLGGHISTANASLVVSPVVTTTYYLRAEGNSAPCTATTACGNITIIVNTQPAITAQPVSATLCNGQAQTFTIGATGTSLVYQWRKAGTAISGATSSTYNMASVATGDAGSYDVVIGGACSPSVTSNAVALVVNSAPSITANPSGQTVCEGSPASLSVGVSAGSNTGLTYQWKKNGTSIGGATGSFYNITATAPSDVANYSVAVTSCGTTVISNPAALSVNSTGTWLGVNANWNDPLNWCGGIPASSTNVTIPVTGSGIYPVISTPGYSKNLTVQNGASLVISNSSLQVSGTISNAGIVDAANGTVEMAGSIAQTIPASTFLNNKLKNLIISNTNSGGVTLNGPVDVYGSVTYSGAGQKLFTNDNLTLKSTAAGTAYLGDMTGNTITGKVTVERYLAAVTAWRFLAIPTNTSQTIHLAWQEGATNSGANPVSGFGTQITGSGGTTAGFDAYSPSPAMKAYNVVSNAWVGVANTNAANIKSGSGYMIFIRGDRTSTSATRTTTPTVLRTKGDLYVGDQPPLVVSADKFVSVGNPYASTIDMRNITKAGIKDFFYLWDPLLAGNFGYGGYQTFSDDGSGNYVITPGGGSYGTSGGISNYIQSGQAFFIQADSLGGTLTFKEAAKTTGSSLVATPATLPLPQLRVNMYTVNSDNSTFISDGFLVNYGDNYSNGVDGMDALKSSNSGENLSIKTSNKLLVIERRHTITSQDTIFFNLTNTGLKKYRFGISATELYQPGLTGYIIDNYLNTRTPLNIDGTTLIDFTIANIPGSYAPNRFQVVFNQLGTLPVTFTSVKAYPVDQNIMVEWKVENESNMKQYEVEKSGDGTNFMRVVTLRAANDANKVYSLIDTDPSAGYNYYRIKSVDINGSVKYSQIVKVLINVSTNEITVYPNPIINNTINLQMINQPGGIYKIRLTNNKGQEVLVTKLTHTTGSNTEKIAIKQNLAKGIYQLEVIKPGQEIITQQITN